MTYAAFHKKDYWAVNITAQQRELKPSLYYYIIIKYIGI